MNDSTKKQPSGKVNKKQGTQVAEQAKDQIQERMQSDQFTEMAIGAGHVIVEAMKTNMSDYKAIDEDKNLSAAEKAIAKRKALLLDVATGSAVTVGVLIVIGVAKKVLAA